MICAIAVKGFGALFLHIPLKFKTLVKAAMLDNTQPNDLHSKTNHCTS